MTERLIEWETVPLETGVGEALRKAFQLPPEHLEDYALLRLLDKAERESDNHLTGGLPSSETL